MTGRRSLTRGLLAIGVMPVLSACQATSTVPAGPPRPLVVDGVGYIVFNAPIAARSREFLLADMERLIAAGARTIRLAMNSPGGEIDSARVIVEFMNRAHATRGIDFEAYGVGLVASAATYVFLSAQRRYARANSGFLFHAAGMVSTGAVSAERLREAADRLEDYERAVRIVLKARTHLVDAAIDVYLHRIVILTADDARRDGVVDAIRDFPLPPNTPAAAITFRPNQAPPAPGLPPSSPVGSP